MKTITMNMKILNIIHAVIDYKTFVCSHNRINPKNDFNWYRETEKYYNSLYLPIEMQHNVNDLEKILDYSRNPQFLEELDNTEEQYLGAYFF